MPDTKADRLARLNVLQLWSAAKPCGLTETCSPDRLQQYRDREREQDAVVRRSEMLED